MQIGDINVVNSILNLENQISVLQQMMVFIIEKNKTNLIAPDSKDIEEFQAKSFQNLQKKYPNMGLNKK